jgi:integrase
LATLTIPHVQTLKDRHGHVRHYYRRAGWPRATLPDPIGSPAFWAAYHAAQAKKLPTPPPTTDRTVNALLREYYRSDAFVGLRDSTKRGYRNMLNRFAARYGDKGVATLQTVHLEKIFHGMAETPGATRNLRKRLAKVFRLAVRLGWRTDNPVTATESVKRPSRGFIPWTEDEITKFENHWPSGTRERLALALLLYTGQRRSDVVGMGLHHVEDGRISVRQLKTDARLKIRLHPALRIELAGRDGVAFLLTQYGVPFSAPGFTDWFVGRAVQAGLENRTPHGLRKAAGRRLAEAGCSAKEIAAVLGHTTLSEVERYTRDADQGRLSDAAFDRLENAETVNPLGRKPVNPAETQ